MKLFRVGLIALLVPQIFQAYADGGHGVATGNGFSRVPIPQEPMSLPHVEALQKIALELGRDFPTLGSRLARVIESFAQPTSSNSEYKVLHTLAENPEFYAGFSIANDRDPNLALPSSATIELWNGFFTLSPDLEQEGKPSQVQVLLHELVHVTVTRMEEERTVILATAIDRLVHAATEEQKNAERAIIQKALKGYPLAVPAELESHVLPFYLRAQNLSSECQDFGSEPLSIGNRELAFPVNPPVCRTNLTQDAFGSWYRERCLSRTLEGQTLLGGASVIRFLSHPAVLRVLVEKTTAVSPTLLIRTASGERENLEGISKNPTPGYERIAPWMSVFSSTMSESYSYQSPLTSTQIEALIPAYAQWRRLAEMNRPVSAPQIVLFSQKDLARTLILGIATGDLPLVFERAASSCSISPPKTDPRSGILATLDCRLEEQRLIRSNQLIAHRFDLGSNWAKQVARLNSDPDEIVPFLGFYVQDDGR